MATFTELTFRYNFWYAFIAFFEDNFDSDWARLEMNKISQKKYGKNVFCMPDQKSNK